MIVFFVFVNIYFLFKIRHSIEFEELIGDIIKELPKRKQTGLAEVCIIAHIYNL